MLIPDPLLTARAYEPSYRSMDLGLVKKIKMIESERASERAGGPARKQEYVVVKKKKLLTYLIMGLYGT